MDTVADRKIEIFAPFSAALDLTKLILFQPFDLGKWFVIGFAAFLSHLNGGGGGGFNYNSKFGSANWNFRSVTHDAFGSFNDLGGWLFPLMGVGVICMIALVLLLMWIGARGKFIFVDCVVRNRGAITEPWNEFKREGNSYFLFSVAVLFLVVVVLGLAGIPLWMPLALHGQTPEGAALFLALCLFGAVALVVLIAVGVISSFMVPIMYRRRCSAMTALRAVLGLIAEHAGPVVLYLLFTIVLWMGFGMISCLLACFTCCITAIPYLGTVIMLPAYVFFLSYLLLFLRQFGPECDAWANVLAANPAPPPAEPPPLPPPLQTA